MGNEELKEVLKQLLGFIGLAFAVTGIVVIVAAVSLGMTWLAEKIFYWSLGGGI